MSILDVLIPKKPPTCSVVIAAAGSSQRCKGEDKLLHNIAGKPVLAHTVEAFEKCAAVREIVVVTKAEQMTMFAEMFDAYDYKKVTKVIVGGKTRTESVNNGIYAVSSKAKYIAVHDGARPCINAALIEETLKKAAQFHAAAPGVPVIPTIKRADSVNISPRDGKPMAVIIKETIDREGLFEIQTPQIFKAAIIKAALAKSIENDIPLTDECMAVELLGMPVHIVESSRRNIKITEPDDLIIAEAFLI